LYALAEKSAIESKNFSHFYVNQNFSVNAAIYRNSLFCTCFDHELFLKNTQKYHTLFSKIASKIAKIFITALTAQSAQKQKASRFT
jgi:hypothetical protein